MKKAYIIALCLIAALSVHIAGHNSRIYDVEEITVSAGATWWDIAKEYSPSDMSLQEYIYNAKKLNQKTSSDLYAGEAVKVMIYSDCQK